MKKLLLTMLVMCFGWFLLTHLQPEYTPVNPIQDYSLGMEMPKARCARITGAPDDFNLYNCLTDFGWMYIELRGKVITSMSFSIPKGHISVGDLVAWYGDKMPMYYTYGNAKGMMAWVRSIYIRRP